MARNIRFKKLLNSVNKIKLVICFVIAVFIIIELLFLVQKGVSKTTTSKKSVKDYALVVLQKCNKAPHRPTCYDKEIPKLMDFITMRDAFEVAKVVVEHDKEYSHCHVLGHYLSGRETKKDPSKWKDVVAQCPANICNNGCLHGPLLTRFNSEALTDKQIEKIKPDLRDVCEPRGNWHPNPVEISMCYHGLGHLNLYITDANVEKSIKLCEDEGVKSNGKNYVQTCVQGVFMQIFQPLEPEDIALVKELIQTKDTVNKFCSQYTGEAWGACHRESWALYSDELPTSKGTNAFCSYSKDPIERRKCFSTILSSMTVKLLIEGNDINKFKSYCNNLDEDQSTPCYSDAAIRLVQIDAAINLKLAVHICSLAPDNGSDCYHKLIQFSKSVFQEDKKSYANFCSLLPESLKNRCNTYYN